MRDDLVAAAVDVEAVHEISAEHGGEILADLAQVEPERGDLVAVQNDLGLGLVDLGVDDRREGEHAALGRLLLKLAGDLEDLGGLGGGGDDELHRKISATRQRGRSDGKHPNACELGEFWRDLGLQLLRRAIALSPGLQHHAAEAEGRLRELEGVGGLRHIQKNLRGLVGIANGFIERGIRRRLNDAENHALILIRRQLVRREDEHGNAEEKNHHPHRVGIRAVGEDLVEHAAIGIPEPPEAARHDTSESALFHARLEKPRTHRRRNRQRHDARNKNSTRQREGKLSEQRTGQPALQADRQIHSRQRDSHRHHRSDEFPRSEDRGVERLHAIRQVALHIFHDHNRIVHHQTDAKDDGQQGEEVHREPRRLHQEYRAENRQGNCQYRNEHRAKRSKEKKNDDDDDQERFDKRLEHLADGIGDVNGRVVAHPCREARRQLGFDFLQLRPHGADHIERVGVWQHPHAHENRLLAAESNRRVVIFRTELHIGDVFQPHHRAAALTQHELLELRDRAEVGIRREVHRHERAFGLAHGGEVVVSSQGAANLRGADVEGRHAVGLQPNPHRKGPPAQNLGALNPRDRREPRLNDPREVVGDFVRLQNIRDESQVGRRAFRVRALDIDDRHLGLGRKVAAHLVHLRTDLRQGLGRVVIQLQPCRDERAPLRAFRLHIINAVRRRDRPLDRRGDETPHEIRVRPDVNRRDGHRGIVAPGILPNRQRKNRLPACDQQQQSHDDRQNRPTDKQIRKTPATRRMRIRVHFYSISRTAMTAGSVR